MGSGLPRSGESRSPPCCEPRRQERASFHFGFHSVGPERLATSPSFVVKSNCSLAPRTAGISTGKRSRPGNGVVNAGLCESYSSQSKKWRGLWIDRPSLATSGSRFRQHENNVPLSVRGGGGTDSGADPASVAASPDHLAWRFGFLSGRVAELVRSKWGGLCDGPGAKCSPATGDRGGRRTSGGPISAERKSGASLHRVRLSNQKQLVASPTGDRQSRTLGERGQSTVRGHLAELARNHLSCPVPLGGAKLV